MTDTKSKNGSYELKVMSHGVWDEINFYIYKEGEFMCKVNDRIKYDSKLDLYKLKYDGYELSVRIN